MLNSVKMAHSRKVTVDKEKAEAKRKAEEAAAEEQAAKKKKEEQEAEKRTWEEKKKLEDSIREIQEEIKNENESLMAAVSRGSRLKEPAVAQAALKTVKACQERIVAKTEDINTKQKKLEKLLQKKPK